jgi:hypothetical protein
MMRGNGVDNQTTTISTRRSLLHLGPWNPGRDKFALLLIYHDIDRSLHDDDLGWNSRFARELVEHRRIGPVEIPA